MGFDYVTSTENAFCLSNMTFNAAPPWTVFDDFLKSIFSIFPRFFEVDFLDTTGSVRAPPAVRTYSVKASTICRYFRSHRMHCVLATGIVVYTPPLI